MKTMDSLIGENNQFLAVLEQTSRLAKINKPVLILGERGTGKELIAQRLHFLSQRWASPLITLNCAALNEQLLDSELFGHEIGAFTGAQKKHKGRFERADGGTLFLDEIGNAPKIVQEKLLRVIEYGQLERVGGNQELKVDVRLVCATNEDLLKASKTGSFRADLLDRLAFDVINLPPLRQRGDDILLLAQHFGLSICRELGWQYFPGFSEEAIAQLYAYDWPGNVRELKNAIERSIYRTKDTLKPIKSLSINPFLTEYNQGANQENAGYPQYPRKEKIATHPPINTHEDSVNLDIDDNHLTKEMPIDLKLMTEAFQVKLINIALTNAHFNQKNAAKLLNLTYDQFRAMLKKYQLTGK